MTQNPTFITVLVTSVNVNTKKTFRIRWSCLPAPAAPVVLQLMWQLKGRTLRRTYYLPLLCPPVYPNSSVWVTTLQESRASESQGNEHVGHSVMQHKWMRWYTQRNEMRGCWPWRHTRRHAESDALSDTYSMTPVRYVWCFQCKTDKYNTNATSAESSLALATITGWNKVWICSKRSRLFYIPSHKEYT